MAKISGLMLAVLEDIASPDEDRTPFPPANTVNALMRRGLVAEVPADRDDPIGALIGGLCVKLVVTDAGRELLNKEGA
jgi:hypothetical protein